MPAVLDNELSIHFGDDKTKSILFSKVRDLGEINISFTVHSSKEHKTVAYFGCRLDSKLSGEVMASKALSKINAYQVIKVNGGTSWNKFRFG